MLSAYEEMECEDAGGIRQEELIVEITEAMAQALRASGLTQSELAARLGKTPGFVSQLMGGDHNLTLRTFADIARALGCRVQVNLVSENKSGDSVLCGDPRPRPGINAIPLHIS